MDRNFNRETKSSPIQGRVSPSIQGERTTRSPYLGLDQVVTYTEKKASRHVYRDKVSPSQSDTNRYGAGGVFELDLGDSEIPLTPKQKREQNCLEEQLIKKEND